MFISNEYRIIAKEITDTMANDEHFLLFIEWAMNNREDILYVDLDTMLEYYSNDREWIEYLCDVINNE